MTNVINLFTREQAPEPQVVDLPHLQTKADPPSSFDDIEKSAQIDFRSGWDRLKRQAKELNLDIRDIEENAVTFTDLGRGMNIAKLVAKDQEAVNYFAAWFSSMAMNPDGHVTLKSIDPRFRGYIYSLTYQDIINASAYAEHKLSSIIGRPVRRVIYFR